MGRFNSAEWVNPRFVGRNDALKVLRRELNNAKRRHKTRLMKAQLTNKGNRFDVEFQTLFSQIDNEINELRYSFKRIADFEKLETDEGNKQNKWAGINLASSQNPK